MNTLRDRKLSGMERPTHSVFKGPLGGLILNLRFFSAFSVFDDVPRRGRWLAAHARCDLKSLSKDTRTFHNLVEQMLTTALRPFSNSKLCSPSSVTQSPLPLLVASTTTHLRSVRARPFVLNDVLSSTRWKSFRSSPIVFTPMDPDFVPDSSGGCSGRGPVLALGSLAVRKRKPRRLRQEGTVVVAIMTSDTHSLWHADMIRSAAARPRGPKRATGVFWPRDDHVALGHLPTLAGTRHFVCTSWSGRVDCKQVHSLDSWKTSACCPWVESHHDFKQLKNINNKLAQSRRPGKKKSRKSKHPQDGVLPVW